MKKNVMMRVASVLLVAVLLTTCAISGTFAKYVAETEGTDTARVAKWDMQINGTSFNDSTFTFDLFKTITDSDGTSAEGDIKPDDGSIIAPGTSGKFALVIENLSEVTAKYWIEFEATNAAGIPIEYQIVLGDGDPSDANWKTDVTALNIAETVQQAASGQTTYTVYWRWIFNGNDVTDTALGVDGTATVAVTATLSAEQVD